MKKNLRKKKGFTLIELMIVIAIIAILAAILVPNFVRARSQGLLTACKSNEKNIGTACEMYSTDNSGLYPAASTGLTTAYIQTIPACPAAGTYSYTVNAGYTVYSVFCSGTKHSGVGGITTANQPSYDSIQGILPR